MVYASGLNRTLYLVNRAFWAFDSSTSSWTELELPDAFGVRHFVAMAFHPGTEELVVFGGGPRGLQYDNATWIYAPAGRQWTRSTGPRTRAVRERRDGPGE